MNYSAETNTDGQSTDTKVETKVDNTSTNTSTDTKVETKVDTKVDNTSTDWRVSIDETYRGALGEDIKDINSLAKQYVEQRKFLGSSIRIPGEDAGDEARREFTEKIKKHAPNLINRPDPTDEQATKEFWEMAGVPKEPNGYKLSEPIEGINEKWLEEIRPQAHKYGLTNQGFESFVRDQVESANQTAQAQQEAQERSLKELHQEWGVSTESKIADVAKFAAEMKFPQSFIDAINNNQVSKEWLKVVDGIITQFGGMKEGSEATFQRGSNSFDTPAELEYKIAEIEANPAFRDRMNPRQQSLINKRMEYITKLSKARK